MSDSIAVLYVDALAASAAGNENEWLGNTMMTLFTVLQTALSLIL